MAASVSRRSEVCVQHDWGVDVDQGEGKFWVSARRYGEPTDHGSVVVVREGPLGRDGFEAELLHDNMTLRLEHDKHGVHHVQRPSNVIRPSSTVPCSVLDCALSPNGGLLAIGGTNGVATIHNAQTTEQHRVLKGHRGDVYSCQFFPSGEVLLTTGADHTLRIWSVADGSCPVVLKGHTAGVLAAGIVDRGRNIISGSRDGSVRLWDCGSASCVRQVYPLAVDAAPRTATSLQGPAVTALAVARVASDSGTLSDSSAAPTLDEHEAGTDDHLVYVATEAGRVSVLDLRARQAVWQLDVSAAASEAGISTPGTGEGSSLKALEVTCLSCDGAVGGSGAQFVAGTDQGLLLSCDLRVPKRPVNWRQQGNAAITAVCASHRPTAYEFVCGTVNGDVVAWPTPAAEHDAGSWLYSGSNLDGISSLALKGDWLYAGCRDGAVRQYRYRAYSDAA